MLHITYYAIRYYKKLDPITTVLNNERDFKFFVDYVLFGDDCYVYKIECYVNECPDEFKVFETTPGDIYEEFREFASNYLNCQNYI